MSTEGPLVHDGSQTTAGADYSGVTNPAALAGPNSTGQYLAVVISATRAVAIAGSGSQIYGVLQNSPANAQAADVGILGITKAVAGAAITAGANVQTDASGRMITQTGSNFIVGVALETVTALNQVFTMALTGPGGQPT